MPTPSPTPVQFTYSPSPTTAGSPPATAAKLTAADGAVSDRFGYSVAVHGDTVVVGAYWHDQSGKITKSGAAYVFTKPDGGWVLHQYRGQAHRIAAPGRTRLLRVLRSGA